jgi:glyceraldehyde 3-phosphate dehydrogenase
MKIAINGFGRIGRNFLRCVFQDGQANKQLEVVAINIGPANKEFTAHMFKYDTMMGTYPGDVCMEGDILVINEHRIQIVAHKEAVTLDWQQYDIDWVVEASGHFTHRDQALQHIKAGARSVLITAPAHDEDITIIPGVNQEMFDARKHHIVSLGSCTTNAFIPMLHVMHEAFTIVQGYMTTVHAYTNTQVLLDVETDDLRRSRAAALNIIPTSTGAACMLDKVLPALAGKIPATSIRVPVAKVSLIDLTICTQRALTAETMHAAFNNAMKDSMAGIIDLTMEPLVSSDFSGCPYSVVIDGLLTSAHGNMGKLFGWYDNEWGYSQRLKDFLLFVACKK